MEILRSNLSVVNSQDVFLNFEKAAHDILKNWIIVSDNKSYEILELEFSFFSDDHKHQDPYCTKAPVQGLFGHWFFNQGAAELTFGSNGYFGSIKLRAVRELESGAFYNGPQRTFRELFENGGSAFEPNGMARFKKLNSSKDLSIIAVPRVGLNLTEFSENMDERIKYILKPYRFIRNDTAEFADKYIAYLYLEAVSKIAVDRHREDTIYKKYITAFNLGEQEQDMENVWKEHSKVMRIAILLGMQQAKGRLIEPEISNESSLEF